LASFHEKQFQKEEREMCGKIGGGRRKWS